MKVYITLDYEIFFGKEQGTIEKTLLYPTELLLSIGRKTNAKFTFFIDCGFLVKLKEYQNQFPHLKEEYLLVSTQIKKMKQEGHDCELHIHPHWERTTYDGQKWIFDYNFYKLSDFKPEEINSIFKKYNSELENITGKKAISFRAGGWCIQPFEVVQSAFEQENLKIDSSVFKGGKNIVSPYFYDYSNAPDKDFWKFDTNECLESKNGSFIELPISSYTYSPLFFWRLYVLGNLFPKSHKPIGNGKPMPSNLTRKKLLTQNHIMSASVDGYFSSKINTIINRNKKSNFGHTVLIGHPKALTHFSLKTLERYIIKNNSWCSFNTFSDFNNEVSR